jgi:hypothetical protein
VRRWLPCRAAQRWVEGDPRRFGLEPSNKARSGALKALAGSQHDVFNTVVINQALRSVWIPRDATAEWRQEQELALIVALMAFEPRDPVEGLLAAQALGLHYGAMECLRRAAIPENAGSMVQLQRQAANLSRAFTEVLDALDRKRGKGRAQVIRIERVQVQAGGQAIVGAVTSNLPPGEVGGHAENPEGQPHASPAGLADDTGRSPSPAGDAGHGRGTGARADRPRCPTGDAGCMAAPRPGHEHLKACNACVKPRRNMGVTASKH